MKKINIVLDTNILLVSISPKSQHHWILQSLLSDKYNLLISNEILMEYDEIVSSKYNSIVSNNIIKTLVSLPNVYKTEIYYNWRLIKDLDDNKFFDCAVSGNANYLVTHDKHFNSLKTNVFPHINIIDIQDFQEILINC